MDDLPTCVTFAECFPHQGRRIRIIGVYTKHLIPDEFSEFEGYVRVQMPDYLRGPLLDLPWGPNGRRDPAEVARFEGKHVVVVGGFHSSTPPKPNTSPYGAHYNAPFIDVESIRLAEPHEIPQIGHVKPFRWPSLFDD